MRARERADNRTRAKGLRLACVTLLVRWRPRLMSFVSVRCVCNSCSVAPSSTLTRSRGELSGVSTRSAFAPSFAAVVATNTACTTEAPPSAPAHTAAASRRDAVLSAESASTPFAE